MKLRNNESKLQSQRSPQLGQSSNAHLNVDNSSTVTNNVKNSEQHNDGEISMDKAMELVAD